MGDATPIGPLVADLMRRLAASRSRAAGALRGPRLSGHPERTREGSERETPVCPAASAQPEHQAPEAVGSEPVPGSRPEADPPAINDGFIRWRTRVELAVLLAADRGGWNIKKRKLARSGSLYLTFTHPRRAVTVCVRIADHLWRGSEAFRQFSLYPRGQWRVTLRSLVSKLWRRVDRGRSEKGGE